MNYTQEEIATMVAKKCEEALAPLYAELEQLQAHYGLRDAQAKPVEPQPTPEEVREAEFKKQLQEMKQMLIKSGRIPKDEAKKSI